MDIFKEVFIKGKKISIIRGDLTESDADAIVNAANSYLQHGGGVARAIARKGGPVIQEESDAIGYVPVGQCAVTSGGKLKARYVIHAVGPRWGEGDERNKLRNAIRSVLSMAASKGFRSIAMPAISAGIFGFPKAECAKIIIEEIAAFLKGCTIISPSPCPLPRGERENGSPAANSGGPYSLKEISLYLFDEEIIGFFVQEVENVERGIGNP
ncbi:MAG TPA: macro domain-containing protein [Syntrophorhabdaceae bacterium]|nr:macro domain-containing protein [Syntrophorhabdaceae bacterium]HQM82300.1 macro domain-containing protein [Syntrophorhabdaceae bacterium]